jgi:hypothetical protein
VPDAVHAPLVYSPREPPVLQLHRHPGQHAAGPRTVPARPGARPRRTRRHPHDPPGDTIVAKNATPEPDDGDAQAPAAPTPRVPRRSRSRRPRRTKPARVPAAGALRGAVPARPRPAPALPHPPVPHDAASASRPCACPFPR